MMASRIEFVERNAAIMEVKVFRSARYKKSLGDNHEERTVPGRSSHQRKAVLWVSIANFEVDEGEEALEAETVTWDNQGHRLS